MDIPFIHLVILHCISKIKGERSVSSIYHLLTGKKSSQTIQDGMLFKIDSFFKTFPKLTRPFLDSIVNQLAANGFIDVKEDGIYELSPSGKRLLQERWGNYSFLSYLNGWKFQYADEFWKRLSLFVQVASHMKTQSAAYIPVQKEKEIQKWMKQFLFRQPYSKEKLSEQLYKELIHFFRKNKNVDPAVIVYRFSGKENIGLTDDQAARFLKREYTLYHYEFISCLHFMMDYIGKNPAQFPLLKGTADGLVKEQPLTGSTKKTYELLQKGYSIEEISAMRNLKLNTIYDHIVELAFYLDDFPIFPYVNDQLATKIETAIAKSRSKQLKTIRQYVPEAEYFQIRLVLAKNGGAQ